MNNNYSSYHPHFLKESTIAILLRWRCIYKPDRTGIQRNVIISKAAFYHAFYSAAAAALLAMQSAVRPTAIPSVRQSVRPSVCLSVLLFSCHTCGRLVDVLKCLSQTNIYIIPSTSDVILSHPCLTRRKETGQNSDSSVGNAFVTNPDAIPS